MTMNEKKLMGIRIIVHRGTNQIGGCVTEYECRGFHLFVDTMVSSCLVMSIQKWR